MLSELPLIVRGALETKVISMMARVVVYTIHGLRNTGYVFQNTGSLRGQYEGQSKTIAQ